MFNCAIVIEFISTHYEKGMFEEPLRMGKLPDSTHTSDVVKKSISWFSFVKRLVRTQPPGILRVKGPVLSGIDDIQ